MADGGLSSIDENHLKMTPVTSMNQTTIDNSKKHKNSFLAQIKMRLSFHKKEKKIKNKEKIIQNEKNDTKIEQNNIKNELKNDKNIIKNDKNNVENFEKSENRFSAIRRSFGKGKTKDNLSQKDLENKELTKNIENNGQNQTRPQSMHIANSYPPRNSFLASFGWYWGPMSRSEATHRLRHQEDGSFLVRDSEGDPNKFTLSFKGAGQIFHNRILQHQNKYAFLPDEEFNSIPDLISDAMRRSATSAYCFSRSTDVTATNPVLSGTVTDAQDNVVGSTDQCTASSNGTHHKHEVRLLKPISRFSGSPRSLFYLCRFMIRQYTRFQDLCKLAINPEIMLYLEDAKYNL